MHESKVLCSEVKIGVRFGLFFCKKSFHFRHNFFFFRRDFGEFFVEAVSGAIFGRGFFSGFAVAWCNLVALPVQ